MHVWYSWTKEKWNCSWNKFAMKHLASDFVWYFGKPPHKLLPPALASNRASFNTKSTSTCMMKDSKSAFSNSNLLVGWASWAAYLNTSWALHLNSFIISYRTLRYIAFKLMSSTYKFISANCFWDNFSIVSISYGEICLISLTLCTSGFLNWYFF